MRRWHSLAGLFRRTTWRERSTWAGAGLVVAAAVWASFAYSAEDLSEYAARWAILGPAVMAGLGFIGIAKKDRAP